MLNEIDLSRADLNLLLLFEAVFEERHVGRSAARLNLSPSAVSHGLGRLRRLLNDPVFLKTPKGVVPTDRASTLAPAIADILQQVRSVFSQAAPFDPATSVRRFAIGAPDGVSAVFLQPLLTELESRSPGIRIGIRQLLPVADETAPDRAWRTAFDELERREIDIAVIPSEEGPIRFEKRALYEEDFVLATRAGHNFCERPTIESYCAHRHLVVSMTGDPHGFVDDILATQGRHRDVALTVPNFMFACAVLPATDLICAIPRTFAALHADQFGLAITEPPISFGTFRLNAFVPKAALTDAGLSWLVDRLADATVVQIAR
ncbi:DNA-binding transcriptional LysR family regulator [Sphingopyxis sp. OAS728]|uniref:LysR family transcriptional regulator n=1 Tax=Sphingopyxis sp. OAS728 TaxID=2663823 RepID=UPI00178AA510|nr:LysR family transcriptional regulator [Sphingopyxis sp. OAS728]MBE1529104.1 DNA-binding transcriptional LysR family regulator [Sphingopyxis sp. OAS728]